jgi:hypothetical protein
MCAISRGADSSSQAVICPCWIILGCVRCKLRVPSWPMWCLALDRHTGSSDQNIVLLHSAFASCSPALVRLVVPEPPPVSPVKTLPSTDVVLWPLGDYGTRALALIGRPCWVSHRISHRTTHLRITPLRSPFPHQPVLCAPWSLTRESAQPLLSRVIRH